MTSATDCGSAPLGTMKIDVERRRDPGLFEQRLGFPNIALGHRKILLIIKIFRVHPLIAGNEFAVEDDLIKRLAVDRGVERLAHGGRFAERIFRSLAITDIDVDAHVAKPECGRELKLGVGADILDVGRRRPFDQIEAAALEIGEPHGVVANRQKDDPVDMDVVLVPVVGEFLADDAILRHAFDKFVRPGADRMQSEFVAGIRRRFRRHHHARAIGELCDQRCKRRLEKYFDRQRIDDFNAIDGSKLRLTE